MTSEGSASWNLSQEITELCIYRAGCGSPTPESVAYFAGTLVVSGFDTSPSTYNSNSSIAISPCVIPNDVLTEKILGNNILVLINPGCFSVVFLFCNIIFNFKRCSIC
jgi:hypothetical protein